MELKGLAKDHSVQLTQRVKRLIEEIFGTADPRIRIPIDIPLPATTSDDPCFLDCVAVLRRVQGSGSRVETK